MLTRLIIFISIIILFLPAFGMAGGKEELEALGGKRVADDYELRYLPPYCRCRAALNADKYKHERKKWKPIFDKKGERGKDWIHLHHYCYGLIMLNRHYRGVGKSSALLREAEAQFNYVITHSSPKFILMPELHLKMGITQKLMGKDSKALQHFIQAIKLKKNYVPAYLHIITYYKEHHDLNNAIKTAKRGLKYSPNSKILKNELQSLSATK